MKFYKVGVTLYAIGFSGLAVANVKSTGGEYILSEKQREKLNTASLLVLSAGGCSITTGHAKNITKGISWLVKKVV